MPVQLDDVALVRQTIAQVELPEGVRLQSVKEYAEWTGEPALQIVYSTSRQFPLTKERLNALHDVRSTVTRLIFPLKLDKYPFVRFEGVN